MILLIVKLTAYYVRGYLLFCGVGLWLRFFIALLQLVTDIRRVIYFAILVFLRLFAIPITNKVIPLQKSHKKTVLLASNPSHEISHTL